MKDKLCLLMALHAHQPVDNFQHIFQQAFEKSYQPFIQILSQFPEIKISLHLSGSLLDWLLVNQPDFIQTLKTLVERGQLEILTAGYYEPILVLLPERDILGQIELHRSKMKMLFGVEPEGLWLSERVWEPSLPKYLKQAGISYTIVDEEHFRLAGRDPESLWGYYLSEEKSYEIAIFPGSKFLRYSLPFKLVSETINYLKGKLEQGKTCITFADDLEKFGFWPHTYQWVYEKKWLLNFFQALQENSSWIQTIHFKQALNEFKPTSRIYLPSASYSEMMDWSDNMFRNFLVKYPESNQLQKRMYLVSLKASQIRRDKGKLEEARISLYKAQANDVYWHGIFGGLYLTHLRYVAYRYLIKAEKILDKILETRFPFYEVRDYDLDGRKEIIFRSQLYDLYLAPEAGGMIYEIDYKPAEINLLNVLTRRPEKYHQKILDKELARVASAEGNPRSIHELNLVSSQGLEEFLIYDAYRKGSWIEHFYAQEVSPQLLWKNQLMELDACWEKRYSYEVNTNIIRFSASSRELKLHKELRVKNGALSFRYNIESKPGQAKFFSSEFNFLFYEPELSSRPELRRLTELRIFDHWFNLSYEIKFERTPLLVSYPLETVSDSEAGIERTYQGCSLHFVWELEKVPFQTGFEIKVSQR